MKTALIFLIVGLLILSILFPAAYFEQQKQSCTQNKEVYFGVTFGLNTTSEAKLLIDKVKRYTNLFIVDSSAIVTNEPYLNEVCDYAASNGMNIIIYYLSHALYPWQITWVDNSKERYGGKFLGIYLYDEPGGKQIDKDQWQNVTGAEKVFVTNASDYSDAANKFVTKFHDSQSMKSLRALGTPVFTSDYALYWFDYQIGYDTIFVQLGGINQTRKIQQIALCRGAANVQNKQWGTIITWSYQNPPYLENGTAMLQDLLTAYRAGAKYIVIFNYPKINDYGILTEDQFDAMKQFWDQIHSEQKLLFGTANGQVAFVLPKDYGWGMRNPNDKIWGLWPPDNISSIIWNNMNKLIREHGLRLDIIYNDTNFDIETKYLKIIY